MGSELRKPYYRRHRDDIGIDEILFCGGDSPPLTRYDVERHAFLRIRLEERYKTSSLSGDEWRFSTMMEVRRSPQFGWVPTSSGYGGLEAHAKALYPELYGDFADEKRHPHDWVYATKTAGIAFRWKGLGVYVASYDGQPVQLLIAVGHLPWSLVLARERGLHHNEHLADLCAQPGCAAASVSTFRLLTERCAPCGTPSSVYDGNSVRGFCEKHLRRGDCGLEDADRNYELLTGVGPDGHEPDPAVVKEAKRVDLGHLGGPRP